ncbi:MAG: hypothetical protein R2689_06035 [Microthrixaceae bacterium]|nr:hypothetical protein [Microthrixaceae bacterium]
MGDRSNIDWIPTGTSFGVEEMTWFVGRGERCVDDVLGDVDLIITGPVRAMSWAPSGRRFVDWVSTRHLNVRRWPGWMLSAR